MTDLERIKELKEWVSQLDLECDIIEKSEANPLDVLLAYLGDSKADERFLQFIFLPIHADDASFTKLLQLYSVLDVKASDDTFGELLVIINEINNMTMLGNFGVNANQEIFYRHVYAMPSIIDSEVSFQEMTSLTIVTIKMFEKLINDLASKTINIEAALDQLANL